jgi:hypothetical protein
VASRPMCFDSGHCGMSVEVPGIPPGGPRARAQRGRFIDHKLMHFCSGGSEFLRDRGNLAHRLRWTQERGLPQVCFLRSAALQGFAMAIKSVLRQRSGECARGGA